MRNARWSLVLTAAVLSLSTSACSHFKKSSKPEVVTLNDTAEKPVGDTLSVEANPLGDGSTLVSRDGTVAAADACGVLPTVYFPFDESNVQEDEAARQLARCLNARGVPSASIEAFADERGATDYNVALSYRRAQSLRKALVREGVVIPLEVVAWGEAFPADPGHDEDAWAQNRRAIATPAGQLLADGRERRASR